MMRDLFNSIRYFREIKRKELYSAERLRDFQFQTVKKTLDFACSRVPYYQETYGRAGIHPEDIRSWEDFERLPILTKKEMRAHPPEFFLPAGINKKRLWKSQTTGSSGIPITVFRNAESVSWDRALIHYCFDILGIKFYHRFCQILALVSDKPNPPGPLARLGFKRNFTVDLRQTDEKITDEIKMLKPDVLFTYPSVFLRLAEFTKSQRIRIRPRWLIAQGEVLPESWRATIEGAFKAPLYHTYGATEVARVGFECREQQGYHLISDAAVTEIWKDGRPANFHEEGEMIITNLNNFCSPLLRYQIGDRGVLSSEGCLCGIQYPLLESITGRLDDFIILPSGRRVSARAITHMQFEGITQYKVVQKSPSQLQILLIPAESFGNQTVEEIQKVLSQAFLGEPMDIEIAPTESLPLSRTGKLQLVTREF